MEKEFSSLDKEWTRLAAGMSAMWKDVVVYSKTEAGTKKDQLKEEMGKHLDDLRKEMNSTYTKGKDVVKTIGKAVEENPWKSIFVAFSLGLLFSKLMDRKYK